LGLNEIFLVAASTDLQRAEIMMKRIREQLEAGAGFKAAGLLQLSAAAVALPSRDDGPLEALVQKTADRITEMAMTTLDEKPFPPSANGDESAPTN
jgi:hypothetical protein